jgi:hypothetical protein
MAPFKSTDSIVHLDESIVDLLVEILASLVEKPTRPGKRPECTPLLPSPIERESCHDSSPPTSS